jgi:hypothetical protein
VGTDVLQDLLARGLMLTVRVLCMIDGGKGCARRSAMCSATPR